MTSPLDPELLKIPAFKRKKMIQQRVQPPPAFTVEDAMRTADQDGMGLMHVEISSSVSRAKEQSRSSRKRVMTPKPRDVHRGSFGSISLQGSPVRQMSLMESTSPSPGGNVLRTYVLIGTVTMVLSKIDVVIIKLSTGIRQGDVLLFEVEGELFEERVSSMQINRKDVKTAKKGVEIGMKISRLPRNGSKVYRVG